MTAARPRFHFTPRAGWVNDPLGLTHHDGHYHLFFQQVPGSLTWETAQHWGHATSDDLLRWSEHEPALSPGDGDEGVWSGSLVRQDDNRAVIFYTAVSGADHSVGRVRVARPDDRSWRTWTKGAVVARLPDDVATVAFRDPQVVWDGAAWLMIVGAGLADGTATALAYRSDDLETWAYDGPLASRHASVREPLWTGTAWECPQLLRVDGRWVLTVSVWNPGDAHDQAYALGDLVDGRFVAEAWHPLSYGRCHYAGSAFTDAAGRPGLIHWLRGVTDPAGAWVGAHSLPHTLHVVGDHLVARPHPHVAAARTAATPVLGLTPIAPTTDLEWSLERGRAAGLEIRDTDGVVVALSSDGSALGVRGDRGAWSLPRTGTAVRVVLDGPVLEVFTDDGILAAQVRTDRPGLAAVASGAGTAVAHRLG